MMKLKIAAFTAIFWVLGGSGSLAHAEDEGILPWKSDNWYGSVGLGVPSHNHPDFAVTNSSIGNRTGRVHINGVGLSQSASLGYEFANGIRVEGEVFYLRYSIDDVDYSSADIVNILPVTIDYINETVQVSGKAKTKGLALNVVYEHDTGHKIVPFFGVGVGKAKVNFNNDLVVLGYSGSGEGSGTSNMFQAMAGVSWKINDRTSLDLSYKLLRIDGGDYLQKSGSTITVSEYRPSTWGLTLRRGFDFRR